MGLLQKIFGRRNEEEDDFDWEDTEEIIYQRSKINMHDATERRKYVESCLEQIADASKEVNLLTGEYNLVTAYLTDMEEIEMLPEEQKKELEDICNRLISLETERQKYLGKKNRMSDGRFRSMEQQEDEIEEGLKKLEETETYQGKIKQDMQKLEAEKSAYRYRKGELHSSLLNLKGMATIVLVAVAICFVMLLILQFGLKLNTQIGYLATAAAAVIAILVIFLKYSEAEKELARVDLTINRLIGLQNTVKIRYVNNTNLLDYCYMKYDVKEAKQLGKLWAMYQEEKEERRKYERSELDREYFKQELVDFLKQFRVRDPGRWAGQAKAILDNREMVEIRHGLIIRRQALRKQMDYNNEIAKNAQDEIKDLATTYLEYSKEITDMVERYEKMY